MSVSPAPPKLQSNDYQLLSNPSNLSGTQNDISLIENDQNNNNPNNAP